MDRSPHAATRSSWLAHLDGVPSRRPALLRSAAGLRSVLGALLRDVGSAGNRRRLDDVVVVGSDDPPTVVVARQAGKRGTEVAFPLGATAALDRLGSTRVFVVGPQGTEVELGGMQVVLIADLAGVAS